MLDIFISRPTWVPDEFLKGLNNFLSFIEEMELNPRTLGSTDYPTDAPLDEVISIMDECKGMLVLGYPQIFVSKGKIKEVARQEEFILPTEWNHIEASLAYVKKLPLLVIHHNGIRGGIFDKGAIGKFIYSVDLKEEGWFLSQKMKGAFKKWKEMLKKVPKKQDSEKKSTPIIKKKYEKLEESDILAILSSHLHTTKIISNKKVINYSEVDESLGLPSGSTKKYIKEIVSELYYFPLHEGEKFITFEYRPPRTSGSTWLRGYR